MLCQVLVVSANSKSKPIKALLPSQHFASTQLQHTAFELNAEINVGYPTLTMLRVGQFAGLNSPAAGVSLCMAPSPESLGLLLHLVPAAIATSCVAALCVGAVGRRSHAV
jgi:hypothetical protein